MTAPSAPPGLDPTALAEWLNRHAVPGVGPLGSLPEATLIAGGKSNLTYRVKAGGATFVLRRPPLGHVLATAHDMVREYRVISALTPTPVPVPVAMALCEDVDVLGAPFYLMSDVPGEIYRSRAQTDVLTDDERRDLAFNMIDTLRVLHEIDPGSVGLGEFGRPAGYLARQVTRWAGQIEKSRSRELPGIDELRDELLATVPPQGRPGIVHGDFRLDNLIIDPATRRVAAVLDWEMATLGDPLADLGLLITYWEVRSVPGGGAGDGIGASAGFPSGAELIARYGCKIDDLSWYVALGCYKLAGICEGIHYRYTLGQTVGAGFDRMGEMVAPLVSHGLSVLKGN